MHLDITTIEHTFEAADGNVRSFPGCSLGGLIEFQSRYDELQSTIAQYADQTITEACVLDSRVRWLCDRCLELNGIKGHWVSPLMLQQLLFPHENVNGELVDSGMLIELNQLRKKDGAAAGADDKPLTIAQAIAQTALITNDNIEQAIALVNQMPAQQLIDLMEATAEIRKSPEDKQKDDMDDWKRMKQAQQMAAL